MLCVTVGVRRYVVVCCGRCKTACCCVWWSVGYGLLACVMAGVRRSAGVCDGRCTSAGCRDRGRLRPVLAVYGG